MLDETSFEIFVKIVDINFCERNSLLSPRNFFRYNDMPCFSLSSNLIQGAFVEPFFDLDFADLFPSFPIFSYNLIFILK